LKILVAEDDAVTRHLLKISLERWNYEVVLAKDGTQAMEIIRGQDVPQLAILDWMMPGSDGVEVCRQLRRSTEGSYVYTLLLTSKTEKEDLMSGLESGADDYLVKPFDLLELQARLRSGQCIIALQDQLIAAREAMRDMAMHDSLTQVWNRGALLE
jgi:DNA-binding response OmpR family regulator